MNIFRTDLSEDLEIIGAYAFLYKVYHTNYSENFVESTLSPFTITIVNPCEDPISLQPKPL